MKRKFIPLIIIFYFTGCLLSYSQTVRVCGTSEYDKYLRSINPDYAKERDQMENKMADFNATHPLQKNTSGPIVIPVVVHIVYNTPEQNLSDDQIVSQIDVLNEDYSTSNANIVEVPSVWSHLVKNSGLTFRLARRDENGDSTSGITRRLTSMGFFSTDNAVKHYSSGGSDAWDRNHFLNIWVCNLDGSVLGYAQYPDHSSSTASTDGIVIGFESFGRIGNNLKPQYNLGRSATHEIGHWLNLVHIWGDADCGDDHVDDTPKQKTNTFGCPEVVHVSCNNGPNGDMFQNYMDYTDDKCMMLFTRLQIDRMIDALRMYRDSIYYQFAGIYANPIGTLATDLQISEIDTPSGIICKKNFEPVLKLHNAGSNTITTFSLDYRLDDDTVLNYIWGGILSPASDLFITLPEMVVSEDLHIFIAKVTSVNGGTDDYSLDNFKTRSFLYSPSKYTCPVYPETPKISIYTDILNEIIIIETEYKDNGQKATFSIYNILGKKIYSKEYTGSHGQRTEVHIGGLANGIYFAEVKTFNKQASKKFVIRH